MSDGSEIGRSNVLDDLSVRFKYIDTDNSVVEFRISRLDNVVVHVFFEVQLFKTSENEFKNSF